MPDHVDAVLTIIEAHRWTRPVNPPTRLTAAAGAAATPQAGPEGQQIHLARPQRGQDRYWVAWTRGEIPPAEIEGDVGRSLRTVVRACETI
eukprot:2040278-Lingulodinium_polyedra.AAC.1